MNKQDILDIAQKAGYPDAGDYPTLVRFANLVEKHIKGLPTSKEFKCFYNVTMNGGCVYMGTPYDRQHPANLMLTFDEDTGILKKSEVLK